MSPELRLVPLTEQTVGPWLSLPHAFIDYGMNERKLAKQLKGHGAKDDLYYMLLDGDKPIAKIAGEINVAGCLEIWQPVFDRSVTEAQRDRYCNQLLGELLEMARQRPDVTYLESKPSEDTPECAWWLKRLSEAGFAEVSVGYVYLLTLDLRKPLPPVPADLQFRPINQVEPQVVAETYGRIIGSTLDRADGSAPEEPIKRLESRKRVRFFDYNPNHWLFCYRDGKPIGFIFTCLEKTSGGAPTAALLMEGGIVPECRGEGLYTHMIRKGMQVAAGKGATRIFGRTDSQNFKPTAVLIKEGFQRQPAKQFIYRRPANLPD